MLLNTGGLSREIAAELRRLTNHVEELHFLDITGRLASRLARLATVNAPIVRSPMASSYLYGMFLAPMTLPCTGPIIVSAFVLGGVSGALTALVLGFIKSKFA